MEDEMNETAIVVGASRGMGRGIATALAEAGANVLAVSRTEGIDAADPTVAARLFDKHDPDLVVLVAGATPHMRPLVQQTWETFSVNWETDVRITFHWLREALLKPLKPGSRVVVFSSGAAVNGSPLSGGYAGAKATQRFITAYAQDESQRAGLGITFTALLPYFAPMTGVGEPAVRAYAARAGLALEEFLEKQGSLVTPEIAGAAVVELAESDDVAPAYRLTGSGLVVL
jgi:3-oxoacyl-[acyl-carrier protein] reductase